MKIEGSVALVTGANRGLGKAFVEGLLAAGARKVYAAARDPAAVTTPGARALALDVTREDQIAAAAAACGDLTLLINNAGVSIAQPLLTAPDLSAMRAEFETNVYGPLNLARAFAPVLKANGGGAIVNILSALSWLSFPQIGGYCASKSAAWSLTNSLRLLLRPQGTQVVGLHVGYMDTDMARHAQGPKTRPEEVVRQVLAALAEGREEVLVDEVSRQVKSGLAAEHPAYLRGLG
jgi:NAD(P)-dependent dehydrogenase (short-subunit alcohol dehydrogenase family)